jgi:site-specific DNA-methyltransferase (adenine-specific)
MSTTNRILHGDCRQMLRTLADCSVDSIVTDPPYELGFMGKHWDASGIAYSVDMWRQCLRVLKPGGHLLAFGGTRTYHRMAVAIEDAGFEVRDSIHWLYGSGFPKSLNVAIAIDKEAGAMGHRGTRASVAGNIRQGQNVKPAKAMPAHEPVTDAAKQWSGWGTALKPAHEPIVVARKPLVGTVAQNVLQHGTGAINIDGGRVAVGDAEAAARASWSERYGMNHYATGNVYGGGQGLDKTMTGAGFNATGRWPANIVLTHAVDCADTCAADCPVAELDRQSGTLTSGANPTRRNSDKFRNAYGDFVGQTECTPARGIDTGGASRFFTVTEWDPITDVPFRYVAKPGKTERNAGLGANFHPTVKPVDLMRWLVRLVTPPGGTVLDPFLGSGTTAVAAILEGFDWVGCELTDDYLPIIEGRVAWAQHRVGYVAPTRVTSSEPDQLELFS